MTIDHPGRRIVCRLALIAVIAFLTPGVFAQQAKDQGGGDANKPKPEKADGHGDRTTVTEHEMSVGGQPLRYRATTGTMVLKDDAGKPKADLFYVAYEKLADKAGKEAKEGGKDGDKDDKADKDGKSPATRPATTAADNPSARPVTFVFNGGPGAASVWLHLGTVGPRRIKMKDPGEAPPPPAGVEDNPATWLDLTDLVFIDPVGTGFSRPATGEKQEEFSGVREDVQWVAEFIRLYLTRNNRWQSPKFLAGESYGTTRAAALSNYLLDRQGVALNGIVFISVVLQFQTISFGNGNELPYVLFLPSYTAIAGYHKRLPEDLQNDLPKTLKAAEKWALDVYQPALTRGKSLTDSERAAVAKDLARFTGLPQETVEKADLRIEPGLFRKALLEDERQLLGRFDGRIGGYEVDPLSREADFDPSLSQFLGLYTAAFNDYARRELKYESDLTYEVLSGRVQPWNFGRSGSGYLDVADNLQDAMRKNKSLHVLFCSGLYDLATPYLATNYTVNHLEVSKDLRRNVAQTYYEGGHMLYHYHPAADQLHADVKRLMENATK